MRYTDLIQLYFDRSNALQWYWTLYVVVVGGLLAFSSLRVRRDPTTALLVTVLFCCFAYKNLGAIHDTTDQRSAALEAIHEFPVAGSESSSTEHTRTILEPTLVAPAYLDVRKFHIASDLLAIAALWTMELRRFRIAKNGIRK